jgi:hypothetical protein
MVMREVANPSKMEGIVPGEDAHLLVVAVFQVQISSEVMIFTQVAHRRTHGIHLLIFIIL